MHNVEPTKYTSISISFIPIQIREFNNYTSLIKLTKYAQKNRFDAVFANIPPQ